jgi:hypothetical protein
MMVDDGPYRHQRLTTADDCVISGRAYPVSGAEPPAIAAASDERVRLYRRPVWRKRMQE